MSTPRPQHDVAAGFTLVIEFADEGTRQTLMIPIDREGRSLSESITRLDGLPLGQTRVDEEVIVNGKRRRVVAVAKTLRMHITFSDE